MASHTRCLAFIFSVVLVGCGSIDPEATRCQQAVGNDYLPFVNHSEWKYEVADAASHQLIGEKGNRILEANGDTLKLEVSGAVRPGVRWLWNQGESYRWLRNLYSDPETGERSSDQHYEPFALRFDWSHDEVGSSWQPGPYTKTSIDVTKCPGWTESLGAGNIEICPADSKTSEMVTETWTVVAVDQKLSDVVGKNVPAGDFEVRCLARTCEAEACIDGTYCFSRGVGKVYELSSELEALASVCIPE